MLYHSLDFAALFAGVATAFWVLPQRWRAPLLLAASYAFYADFEPAHLALLVAVSCVAYAGAIAVSKSSKRWPLALSVGLVLSALAVFKYYRFTWEVVGAPLPGGWSPVLPIGISFYSFQAVSYLVDVRRGTVEAERSPLLVGLYLAFFPQILAGPIERAGALMEQLRVLRRPSAGLVYTGAKVILWGLFCKLVVADKLGLLVDPVFAAPGDHSSVAVAGAVYLYSFQIFFDFYGYTNVSIGIARILGVELSINFDNPYLARSVRDFWRRWHITLTSWFRDYVYVPLGGRSASRWIWTRNVFLVFLLSGLWHGAALNFVAWGALHGLYYVAGAALHPVRVRLSRSAGLDLHPRLQALVQILVTFHLVTFAWLVFRVGTIGGTVNILASVVEVSRTPLSETPLNYAHVLVYLTITFGALVLQMSGAAWQAATSRPTSHFEVARDIALADLCILGLVLLGDIGARSYIYFRF